ncbi:MAG: extracellular solute-binding protein [Candidatus Gracilibacteria bacterium]|nr:extracellular solute-binding protein [Candidatus Gracilibacteria bacterium]
MNKNKIIFLIIGVIILISLVILVSVLNSNSTKQTKNQKGSVNVWIVGDDQKKFNDVLLSFKAKFPQYKDVNIVTTSFPNYGEYFDILMASFLKGKNPDIFVLNNNDTNFFSGEIMGIDPKIISPDDFRKNYDIVFSNDLIKKIKIQDKDVEYLAGIPLGYEVLGLFYNFREIKGKNLSTWSYINDTIREINQEAGKTTIGIGNGSSVAEVEDIITQFLILDGVTSLSDATGDKLKSSLSNYIRFGDENLENKYNALTTSTSDNNLKSFSKGDIQMLIGYPRLLEEIDKNGFNKNFLRAEPFPTYTGSGKLLVNYNYFVINKNTKNSVIALDLMKYFSTQEGQKKYLEKFSYYLPSMLSLINNRLEETLKNGYTLKYKNFYNPNIELTSFNKGIENVYNKEITSILDKGINSVDLFEILRKRLLCMSNKIITFENLGNPCE